MTVFKQLDTLNDRPAPFSRTTVRELWTDAHVSAQMLAFHLDPDSELASRPRRLIERMTAWLAARFEISEGTRVCDLGCGPGLYTTEFAELGAAVTGVDFSARSIAHARAQAEARGLSIDYVHGDYLELELPSERRFDLITLIYWDLCALAPTQRRALYRVARAHLVPGGAFVFDALTPAYLDTCEPSRSYELSPGAGFWAADRHYVFKTNFIYAEEQLSLDRYLIVEADRTREVYNWLQCFTLERLARELEVAGFGIIESHGDLTGAARDPGSTQLAIVATPRTSE